MSEDTRYRPQATGPVPTRAELARLPYRLGVGALLFNRERLVFAGQRSDTPGAWQLPQGGIDEGEDPEAAMLRELEEEIGTANARVLAETSDWLTYDLPPEMVPKIWKGRYRGQKQKWYALEFLGEDREIDIFAHTHPEFDSWRWMRLAELPPLIVPFKRGLYDRLLAEFGHLAE